MTRFGLPRVRPGQPQCWKLTPVYCACQEPSTIYCTLGDDTGPNSPQLACLPCLTGSARTPEWFLSWFSPGVLSTSRTSASIRRSLVSIFWLVRSGNFRGQTDCLDSTRRESSGQRCGTVDCVDKEGFLLKSRPPIAIAVHKPRRRTASGAIPAASRFKRAIHTSSSNRWRPIRIYLNKT
jgi:hypothetical protein